MDIGRDVGWFIQRAAAHEPHLRPGIFAEDRDLAARTSVDPLHAAVVTRRIDRLRRFGDNLDALGLDEEIDNERAAGLALTVQTVAAMNEQRR